MSEFWITASAIATGVWSIVLLLPWRPWSTREQLESEGHLHYELSDVSVLIPARNEASEIPQTFQSLQTQGRNLKVILIDDQSDDGTSQAAQASKGNLDLEIVSGAPLPEAWAGKLWALEQGRARVKTPYTLLMDADIRLAPGMIGALKQKLVNDSLDYVSLMAHLRMKSFWEKLLIPAYIYFFKLLYPFALGNNPRIKFGVGAGGCVFLKTSALESLGGFSVLKGAIIDDCTLAQKLKERGFKTWIGLTRSVTSHRGYDDLKAIWNLVARSAFTQLRYSFLILVGCTLMMMLMFWIPWIGVTQRNLLTSIMGFAGVLLMLGLYRPTLKFYNLSPLWSLALPVIGTLYLMMTWTSAFRFYRGQRSIWKGRVYQREAA